MDHAVAERRGGHTAKLRLVDVEVGVGAGLPSACGEFLMQEDGMGLPAGVEAGGCMAAHFPLHGAAGGCHHVSQ